MNLGGRPRAVAARRRPLWARCPRSVAPSVSGGPGGARRGLLADLNADAPDAVVCAYVTDITAGTAPASEIPNAPGSTEREQRRAVQRAVERPTPTGALPGRPMPTGLLPAAAHHGKAPTGAPAEVELTTAEGD